MVKDWDVDFDVDEYQQMMGTQVGQMALGLATFWWFNISTRV